MRAWEDWDAKNTSENDHPLLFPDQQVLEDLLTDVVQLQLRCTFAHQFKHEMLKRDVWNPYAWTTKLLAALYLFLGFSFVLD